MEDGSDVYSSRQEMARNLIYFKDCQDEDFILLTFSHFPPLV